ncbi:Nn.00g110140.m01.CDS01 [Neocucurbitaria sp. VM-36]
MPASVASAPVKRTANRTTASRTKKPAQAAKKPQTNGAVNGASQAQMSPYTIMASRIANRVAEMAENMTFVEREKPQEQAQQSAQSPKPAQKKPPRKLEMRIPNSGASPTNITFSAPFLDNTLSKLLTLQNRMLKVSNDIAASEDVDDQTKQEQFAQSAELSRIIALICAEKARQGA